VDAIRKCKFYGQLWDTPILKAASAAAAAARFEEQEKFAHTGID
jgi:hypothetical protein